MKADQHVSVIKLYGSSSGEVQHCLTSFGDKLQNLMGLTRHPIGLYIQNGKGSKKYEGIFVSVLLMAFEEMKMHGGK